MTITEQQFYDMLDVDEHNSKDAMEFLGIQKWTEQAIEHIESKFPDWIPLVEEKKEQVSLFE